MTSDALLFDSTDMWDEDDEPSAAAPHEPIAVSFQRLVGIVAHQLRDIASRLDVEQDWPIEQLDQQSLGFLQNLDLHSQQLKEMADLLSHVDVVPQAKDVVQIATCLESLNRLIREA